MKSQSESLAKEYDRLDLDEILQLMISTFRLDLDEILKVQLFISDFQIDGGEGQAPEEGQHHGGGQKGRLSDFFFSYLASSSLP